MKNLTIKEKLGIAFKLSIFVAEVACIIALIVTVLIPHFVG